MSEFRQFMADNDLTLRLAAVAATIILIALCAFDLLPAWFPK